MWERAKQEGYTIEQLDTQVKSRQTIHTDVQKLMLIVSGDQKLLNELVGGVQRIEQRLDEGYNPTRPLQNPLHFIHPATKRLVN